MTLTDYCNEILLLNPKIRFAGIYYHSELTSVMRDETESLLTYDETMSSMRAAVIRWGSRKMLKQKLGLPHFEMARYDKVFRLTFSLGENDLLLVSTDIDCNILEIESKLEEIQKKIIRELNN